MKEKDTIEKDWLLDDDHRMFRDSVRKWVAEEIVPCGDWREERGEFPVEVIR